MGALRLAAAAVGCLVAASAGAQFFSAQDTSVVGEVRMAARGGDYAMAFDRIDRIASPGIKSQAHAALAVEYADEGQEDLAVEQFGVALHLAATGKMQSLDRARAYAYLAIEKGKVAKFAPEASEALEAGLAVADEMEGVEQDLAHADLAFAAFRTGDAQFAREIAGKMKYPDFREKVIRQVEESP